MVLISLCVSIYIASLIFVSIYLSVVNVVFIVCLDGTPPAYHLDRGSGTGLDNWVISIEVSFVSILATIKFCLRY